MKQQYCELCGCELELNYDEYVIIDGSLTINNLKVIDNDKMYFCKQCFIEFLDLGSLNHKEDDEK